MITQTIGLKTFNIDSFHFCPLPNIPLEGLKDFNMLLEEGSYFVYRNREGEVVVMGSFSFTGIKHGFPKGDNWSDYCLGKKKFLIDFSARLIYSSSRLMDVRNINLE